MIDIAAAAIGIGQQPPLGILASTGTVPLFLGFFHNFGSLEMPVIGMYLSIMTLLDQMELPLPAVKQDGGQLYAG